MSNIWCQGHFCWLPIKLKKEWVGPVQNRGCIHFHRVCVKEGGFDVAANKSDNSFSWIPHSDCSPRVAFPFPECYRDMMEVSLSRGTQSNVQSAVTGGTNVSFLLHSTPPWETQPHEASEQPSGRLNQTAATTATPFRKKTEKKKPQVRPAKRHATSTKCTKEQSHECWRCLGPTTELIKPFRWPHRRHPLANSWIIDLIPIYIHPRSECALLDPLFFKFSSPPPPPSSAAKSPHNRDSYGALFNIYGNRRISLRQQSLTAFSLPSTH